MTPIKRLLSYSLTIGLGLAATPLLHASSNDGCTGGELTAYGCSMPKTLVSGNTFPVPAEKIESWLNYGGEKQDAAKMIEHSWAIWAALNDPVDFKFTAEKGQKFTDYDAKGIERFLTWTAPKAIARGYNTGIELGAAAQLQHGAVVKQRSVVLAKNADDPVNRDIIEGVLYSPASAKFAMGDDPVYNPYNLNLLIKENVDWIFQQGAAAFPDFPNSAVNIKPVFKHLADTDKNTQQAFTVWNGLPETAKAYPEKAWTTCATVSLLPEDKDKSGAIHGCDAAATAVYGLNNFIHITIDKNNIDFYKNYFFTGEDFKPAKKDVKLGDVFILVAMHVTTKEIPPWTWMTFWWDPTPETPELPSTQGMLAGKKVLNGQTSNAKAVQHYALSSGYRWTEYGKADADAGFQSVYPAVDAVTGKGMMTGKEEHLKNRDECQLVNNTKLANNTKGCYDAVNVFNPYLEAGFNSDTFNYNVDHYTSFSSKDIQYTLIFGVQTNCTSCHGMANKDAFTYNVDKLSTIHELRQQGINTVDFAWSILVEMINLSETDSTDPSYCEDCKDRLTAENREGGIVYIYK